MQKHTDCKEYLKQLSDYVDGELSAELCTSLERHMQGCTNCRIVVDTLRKTIDLYQEESQDEVLPQNVRSRLFARLKLDDLIKNE